MCLDELWLQGDCPFVAKKSLLRPSHLIENAAEVHLNLGQIRLERQGPPAVNQGFVQVVFCLKDKAQIDVRDCAVGVESQGALVLRGCLLQPALRLERGAEVAVVRADVSAECDCLFDPRNSE